MTKLTQFLAGPGKRAICGAACAAFSLQSEVCFAQADVPVDLSWEAPEGCSQQVEVEQQIRLLVGTPGETRQVSRLRVTGTIEPFNEHYRLTLLIERNTTHGTRIIESDDCQSLGKAAAVVVGLLVRRQYSGRELTEGELSGRPELPLDVTPPTVPVPPVTQPPPQPPTPAKEREWRLLVRGPELSADFLTLPRTSYGLNLGLGTVYHEWHAFVSGGPWLSQTKSAPVLQPYQADFRRWSVEAWVCRGLKLDSFEIAPCGLVAFDDVIARASGGGRVPRQASALWLSAGGGITGYWHFGRNFAAAIRGSGRLMTKRPQFIVEGFVGDEQVHRVPLGTFVASLGGEWIF